MNKRFLLSLVLSASLALPAVADMLQGEAGITDNRLNAQVQSTKLEGIVTIVDSSPTPSLTLFSRSGKVKKVAFYGSDNILVPGDRVLAIDGKPFSCKAVAETWMFTQVWHTYLVKKPDGTLFYLERLRQPPTSSTPARYAKAWQKAYAQEVRYWWSH